MKKILSTLLTLGVTAAMLAGCRKEPGTAALKNINSLKITTDLTNADPTEFITADSITLKQNDSLKVKLKISQSLGNAQNFSYRWTITQSVSSNANPAQYVVGTSAQLATKRILLPPNLYRLVAEVTDKAVMLLTFKFFQLNDCFRQHGEMKVGWFCRNRLQKEETILA